MKKSFIATLAIGILSLTACSKNSPENKTDAPKQTESDCTSKVPGLSCKSIDMKDKDAIKKFRETGM